jgi:hypothetical protein
VQPRDRRSSRFGGSGCGGPNGCRSSRTDAKLVVTDLGRQLVRIIAMRFDAYLPRPAERRHAMTI